MTLRYLKARLFTLETQRILAFSLYTHVNRFVEELAFDPTPKQMHGFKISNAGFTLQSSFIRLSVVE